MTNHWILIADDDEDFADILRQLLEEEGYRVVTAPDGFTALEIMQREGAPTALLLDMMMPGLDGHEVLQRLRSLECHTEVIVMTAFPSHKERAQFEQEGVRAVLSKPVSLDEVTQQVRAVIAPPSAS